MYDASRSATSSTMMNPNGNMQNIRLKIPTDNTETYGTPRSLVLTITLAVRLSSARAKKPLDPEVMYVL